MAQISLEQHCKWCGVAITATGGSVQAADGSTYCSTGIYMGNAHAVNTNCLDGYRCPSCLLATSFDVTARQLIVVVDSGTDNHPGGNGDTEWDDDYYMKCRECGHDGVVDDFKVKPPDLTDPSNIEAFLAEL